jgi:hypothetical protein
MKSNQYEIQPYADGEAIAGGSWFVERQPRQRVRAMLASEAARAEPCAEPGHSVKLAAWRVDRHGARLDTAPAAILLIAAPAAAKAIGE